MGIEHNVFRLEYYEYKKLKLKDLLLIMKISKWYKNIIGYCFDRLSKYATEPSGPKLFHPIS